MLTKGLQVLQYLAEQPQGEGVSEIARALDFPMSTTHRLLATMVSSDWVSRVPETSAYRLGPQVLRAAESLRGTLGMASIHELLADLAGEVGETVILGTLVDQQFIYLDLLHGPGLLGIKGSPGRRGPLHCTAIGKALLSGVSDARRTQLIGELELTAYTPSTITSSDQLEEEIQRSRRRGYSLVQQEYEDGVTSVGVPIRLEQHPEGVYAICITAPSQRAEGRVDDFATALSEVKDRMRTAGMSPR